MPDGTATTENPTLAQKPVPVGTPPPASGASRGPSHPEDRPAGGPPQSSEQTAAQPTETAPERVKQSEVVEGGNPNLEIWLDPTTQKLAAERLINRLQAVKALDSKELPLTTIDRLVQKLGPEAIARLEQGHLTREDLAIAAFVLRDEFLQKSLAAGKLVKDVKTIEATRLGKIPFFRRIVKNPILQTQLETSTQQLSTEYTREIGFDQWTQDRIENDLVALNQLRTNVELSFYGRHLDDPLFDQDSISLYTVGRKTGNRLHDAVVDELMGTEGILTQRFGGKTLLELSQEDPIAAMQALFEANQRALTQFAGETAKELLKAESPKTEEGLIEKQATKLETKPTQEDLTKLQGEVTRTIAEFTGAQTRLSELNAPIEAAEKILTEKQLAYDKAKNNFAQISARLDPEIKRLADRVESLYNKIQEPDPSLTPEQKADLQRAAAATSQNIARIEAIIQSYHDKLNQLLQGQIDAELDLNQGKNNVAKAKKDAQDKGLDDARSDFDQKKAAKETAENELKEKQQNAVGEASPEAKEKAKALREWAKVVTSYDKIVDARFSQEYGDEYTRERLANIKERPDGQIEGAERIREHIFRLVLSNKADYDPTLARKMLSDETIAKAIIWVYKLDPETISTKGNTLNQLLSDLNKTKDMIRETPEDKDLLKEKADQEKEIIKLVLPYLKSSQFKAGDLLRFVIHEGLKSAERDNPYLALDEYYAKPKPELRLEAESIYKDGVGTVEIDPENNTVKWIGSITNSTIPGLANNNLLITYRIDQQINPDNDIYSAEILTDQRFLQSLPGTLGGVTLLPEAIRNAFYDESGKLRADRTLPGSWTMFIQDSLETTDDVLSKLQSSVAPEASRLLSASIANYILEKPPQERLEILRGLNADMPVPSFRSAVNIPLINDMYVGVSVEHAYTIDFDNNGNFFIADESGDRQELKAFYQRELEKFTEKLNVQTLNPKQREDSRIYFLTIQQTLGQEILRAMQRR